jgi:hypothetical protein
MNEKTIKDAFLEYKSQIEAGAVPKTVAGAFATGVRFALESLGDPFGCPVCIAKILEMTKQVEEFHPKTRLETKMKIERAQ